MSPPQPGDGPTSPDASRPGGLANVFRGLTTSRSSRSLALSSSSSSVALPVADIVTATPTTSVRLSPNTMDSFELLKSGSLNDRIGAANTLKFAISEYPLNPVLDIWYAGKDLIDSFKPATARAAGWELLTECVKHASSTDLERQEYFQTLAAPANPEDFHLQLAALVDLTQNGRNLDGFDYELLPLLNSWLREGYKAVRAARKNASASRNSRNVRSRVVVTGEEKNFAQLFAFLKDVLKFSFRVSDDKAIAGLLDVLLEICISTSVEDDIRASITVMDTVLTFGSIPRDKLKSCIQVLSSVFCLVANLQKEAWRSLSNILRSHNGQKSVRILLEVLRGLSVDSLRDKDMSREIRGSLAVLQKLLSKNGTKGYPVVPYAWLVEGLSATVKASPTSKIRSAVLSVVNSLFHDSRGGLHQALVEEDWSVILNIAAECCGERRTKGDHLDDPVAKELLLLIEHLQSLLNSPATELVSRSAVVGFFAQTHAILPDTAACAVLDYFQEFRSCSPTDPDWEDNLGLVLDGFFANRDRSSETRLRAFRIIMDAYDLIELVGAMQDSIPGLAKSALKNIADETDVAVLDAVVTLMVSISSSCDIELFDFIISAMRGAIENDRLRAPVTAGLLASPIQPLTADDAQQAPAQSPSDVITKGYVKMFIRAMNSSSEKSVKLFNTLLQIAKSSHGEVDARLTAMKLLFRLRADWASKIFLTKELETNFLASIIGRTDGSAAAKRPEDMPHGLRLSLSEHSGLSRPVRGVSFSQGQPPEKGLPVRSASGARPSMSATYRNLWKLPDPDALPGDIPVLISPLLVSHETDDAGSDEGSETSGDGSTDEEDTKPVQVALDIALWLETVLGILGGSDWEVYSFVLVHLPSQLSNHAIFTNAIPQIEELRKLICEHIRTNKFQEPPNASGLRRADVAICLFHSLTMILSYHEHFQKGEEDEIVRTFVHGIGASERTAQCCIHALSICCHELPLSATKSLGQMLNQMAGIITQPNVAIHILEFLASLSRLQNVYVNFREEEYRTIFGICFRYLDYARDKRQQANRGGPFASEPPTPSAAVALSLGSGAELARPSASDDLPQYVYALAYHVILFWFLALKLPDRATHVGTIIKRLCIDVDGSGNPSDEQALTTIDFMRRATYADVDESTEDPLFSQERFGEMVGRHWVIGSSIVTIKQAVSTGWAQITKRQASGTSVYMVRESLQPPPLHQVDHYDDAGGEQHCGTVLPSHLLIQLLASVPQSHDRPIPLPADDTVDRTLRVFDRISTVDGHKVGVIYIGEGQSDEREILGNVSGSSDYVEFLNNLGTLTKLKGAKFNTQGLDREYDTDGEYTFCWRDRLTEMVFHVTTQMPSDFERDPQMANKKRHIGNDFVNIIFNDSGLPFKFDTFPSQFNYVNIVITPASRASFVASREAQEKPGEKRQPFYRVQVMSKPGFPDISPAFETKMVSLKALPGFIRLVALNASVFSLSWQNRTGGEHVSSWRGRLREIKKLRERYGPKTSSGHGSHGTSPSPPPMSSGSGSVGAGSLSQHQAAQHQADAASGASGRPSTSVRDSFNSLRRTSVATFFTSTSEQTSHRSSVLSGSVNTNDTEVGSSNYPQGSDALVDSVNFSKWA